jgi:hypothetical protein
MTYSTLVALIRVLPTIQGFFSLFWISMFLFTLRTYIRSLETNGYALSLAFATMFSKDAMTLVVSDAVLVASTAICVPFAKAISKGWMPYYWTGLILQHFLQSLILFGAVTWTFNRCVYWRLYFRRSWLSSQHPGNGPGCNQDFSPFIRL